MVTAERTWVNMQINRPRKVVSNQQTEDDDQKKIVRKMRENSCPSGGGLI